MCLVWLMIYYRYWISCVGLRDISFYSSVLLSSLNGFLSVLFKKGTKKKKKKEFYINIHFYSFRPDTEFALSLFLCVFLFCLVLVLSLHKMDRDVSQSIVMSSSVLSVLQRVKLWPRVLSEMS